MYANYTGTSLIWLRGTPGLDDVDAWVFFFFSLLGWWWMSYVDSSGKGLGMMMVSDGWLLCGLVLLSGILWPWIRGYFLFGPFPCFFFSFCCHLLIALLVYLTMARTGRMEFMVGNESFLSGWSGVVHVFMFVLRLRLDLTRVLIIVHCKSLSVIGIQIVGKLVN